MTASGSGGSQGRFRAMVDQVIQLTRARDEEYERLYPSTGGVLTGTELLKRSMDALTGTQPRPAERAFTQFLGGLEAADLCALVTLHYVGRNFRDSDEPEKALLWQRNNMRSSHVSDEAFAKLSERRGLDEWA